MPDNTIGLDLIFLTLWLPLYSNSKSYSILEVVFLLSTFSSVCLNDKSMFDFPFNFPLTSKLKKSSLVTLSICSWLAILALETIPFPVSASTFLSNYYMKQEKKCSQ